MQILKLKSLFIPHEPVVVAVSGGLDSVALIHSLAQVQHEWQIRLHVATFDHGLREASAGDADFVEQLAKSLGLACSRGRASADLAERTSGVEAAAREQRYAFLAQVAHQVGARRVATAHHADDQAETLLLHILRGSGGQGLLGMRAVSPLPGAEDLLLIRPLLETRRETLRQYCLAHGLQYREDATNTDESHVRNWLRHSLLPLLREAVNPRVDEALLRLAAASSRDADLLEQWAGEAAQALTETMKPGVMRILKAGFRDLHVALQYRLLLLLIRRYFADCEVGAGHLDHAVRLAQAGAQGAIAEFPAGVSLRVDYEHLWLLRGESLPVPEQAVLIPAHTELELAMPGVTEVPGTDLQVHLVKADAAEVPGSALAIVLEAGQVLRLRARRPGDRWAPAGMGGQHKSLKTWMIDHKVPGHLRDQLPLLLRDDEILAIHDSSLWHRANYGIINNSKSIVFLFITRK